MSEEERELMRVLSLAVDFILRDLLRNLPSDSEHYNAIATARDGLTAATYRFNRPLKVTE